MGCTKPSEAETQPLIVDYLPVHAVIVYIASRRAKRYPHCKQYAVCASWRRRKQGTVGPRTDLGDSAHQHGVRHHLQQRGPRRAGIAASGLGRYAINTVKKSTSGNKALSGHDFLVTDNCILSARGHRS